MSATAEKTSFLLNTITVNGFFYTFSSAC